MNSYIKMTMTGGPVDDEYDWAVSYAKARMAKSKHMVNEDEWTMPDRERRLKDYIERGEVDEMISLAARDAKFFDAAKHLAAYYIEQRTPLPHEYERWIAEVLRGETHRPKGKAGRPSAKGKDRALCRIIQEIVKHTNLTATRNTEGPPRSACDAVAKAMAELGMHPASWSHVTQVWTKRES